MALIDDLARLLENNRGWRRDTLGGRPWPTHLLAIGGDGGETAYVLDTATPPYPVLGYDFESGQLQPYADDLDTFIRLQHDELAAIQADERAMTEAYRTLGSADRKREGECVVVPCYLSRQLVPVVLLVGCAHWERYPIPSSGGPRPHLPSSLRVTTSGSSPNVVVEPFVRADTLYGTSLGDTVAHALPTIRTLERQRLDTGRTIATVVGGLAAWITLGLLGGALE